MTPVKDCLTCGGTVIEGQTSKVTTQQAILVSFRLLLLQKSSKKGTFSLTNVISCAE